MFVYGESKDSEQSVAHDWEPVIGSPYWSSKRNYNVVDYSQFDSIWMHVSFQPLGLLQLLWCLNTGFNGVYSTLGPTHNIYIYTRTVMFTTNSCL